MALRQLVVLLVTLGASFGACTRVEVAGPSSPPPLEEGGAAGQPAGGAGAVQAGDNSGGEADPSWGGAAPASLEVGVWPTFVEDPTRSRDVQAAFASVAALSAGAAALPLFERWDALSGASGTPLALTWNRLDAMIEPYRVRGARVSLCIGIVDRTEPAWPFAGDLRGDAAKSVMERTVDEALSRYGGVLSHLCFGYELDRYWKNATAAEREQLLEFLNQSVGYARAHPLRSTRTSIGVALSLAAFTGSEDAPLAELNVGDELLGVYDPLGRGAELKPPGDIADELAAALKTVAELPGPRVAFGLLEVGYPSAKGAGASERAQRDYFRALFGALDERREGLSFLGVFGLGDRAATECDAESAKFGGASAAVTARSAARCSMGLRAEGADKPAWGEVLAAIARYR